MAFLPFMKVELFCISFANIASADSTKYGLLDLVLSNSTSANNLLIFQKLFVIY